MTGGEDDDDCLLRVKEVAAMVTFSVRKIWRDMSANKFPRAKKLGPKSTRWWKSEILRFLRGEWKPHTSS